MYMAINCLLKEVCSLVRNAHDILIIRDFHTNVIRFFSGSWAVECCSAFRKTDLGSICSPLEHWVSWRILVISEGFILLS